jgi:hypothetical protein
MTKEHSISDIAFASYLVQQGHEISSVNRRGRKVMWVFTLTDDQIATAEAQWPSSAPAKFYSTYQTLKTHIKVPKHANKPTDS